MLVTNRSNFNTSQLTEGIDYIKFKIGFAATRILVLNSVLEKFILTNFLSVLDFEKETLLDHSVVQCSMMGNYHQIEGDTSSMYIFHEREYIILRPLNHITAYNVETNTFKVFSTTEEANKKGFFFNPNYISRSNVHFKQSRGALTCYVNVVPKLNRSKLYLNYGLRLEYNLEDNKELLKYVKENYESTQYLVTKKDILISNEIGSTIGCEFETCNGSIDGKKMIELGCVPLRDGSIDAYEYTTIPLQGAKGISSLRDLCSELSKYTSFNTGCSFHFHYDPKFESKGQVVAFYHLCLRLENEIFNCFPNYKRDERGVMRKSKNYSGNLFEYPGLELFEDESFNNLYDEYINVQYKSLANYIAAKDIDSDVEFGEVVTPGWSRKYHSPTRYTYINFAPYFTKPQATIEFRRLEATFDFNLIIANVLMVSSMVKYAKNNVLKILQGVEKITLNRDILDVIENNSLKDKVKKLLKRRRNDFSTLKHKANLNSVGPEGVEHSIRELETDYVMSNKTTVKF